MPDSLRAAARTGDLAGFVLFKRNLGAAEQSIELTRALVHSFPEGFPPVIAVDQEGGRVARLGPPVLQLPAMQALGRHDDVGLTRRAAETLGAQLHALGFSIDFAPVLDVNSNPLNPVIGDRAFGSSASVVTRHGRAFAAGLQAQGVAACGKHFPGHGDTSVDSHLALPRVDHARARLDQVELAPFRALAPTLACVMTAHVVFPALDPQLPATLSVKVLDRLLREACGFKGVVFADDLEMKAISDHHGIVEASCRCIAAGCDALLICKNPELTLQAHEGLVRRAENDSSFRARLEAAAARVHALRQRYRPRPSLEAFERTLAAARDLQAELQIVLQRGEGVP